MEGESGFTRSINDQLPSSDIQGEQMEDESGVTQSINHESHSWDSQGHQIKVKVVLLEVPLMNFILRIW